jgi:aminoglycoside phosphotransferase family enzyme/predicted kinase
MVSIHQSAIRKAMMQPGFYPHPVQSVELRETHISTVFLTGPYAYKIKKPVDLGFLDFSTLAKRKKYGQLEVSLNRRLSHGVYLDVLPVTCHGGRYGLDGPGEAVEFAVRMRQLAESDSMQQRLRRNDLTDAQLQALVHRMVGFYTRTATDCLLGTSTPSGWDENLQQIDAFAGVWIDRPRFEYVRTAAHAFARSHRFLFDRRRTAKKIKDGHGDLRTDHIYFTSDGIQVIDCIEFSPSLRCLDVISDLAFLAMDLDCQGFTDTARDLIRWYIETTDDLSALPLVDFYCCYRAMVRCKVCCCRLQERALADPEQAALQASTSRYLDAATDYATALCRPTLWMVCGLPASGKSTVARELAAVHAITVIRSDEVRKELFAGKAEAGTTTALDRGIYSAGATEATYNRMLALADETLKKGASVVIDATFSRRMHRVQALRMAERRQVRPIFVECRAAEAVLAARLKHRESRPSVSDARLIHLDAFKNRYEPIAPTGNAVLIGIDTAKPLPVCLRQVLLTAQFPTGSQLPDQAVPDRRGTG